MESELEARLRVALDKQEIHDVLMRYCRGIDRRDRDLVRSSFHGDATLDYGRFQGPPSALDVFGNTSESCTHFIGNVLIEVQGDIAVAESYLMGLRSLERDGKSFTRARVGRYVDRFERRAGAWKIARRLIVDDWSRIDEVVATVDDPGVDKNRGVRSPEDPFFSFQREAFAGAHGDAQGSSTP